MRISDWSSDVCSSDLGSPGADGRGRAPAARGDGQRRKPRRGIVRGGRFRGAVGISPLHAARRLAGPPGAGGADLRASRAGPPVAPRPGGGDYEDAPPGSLGALHEGPPLAAWFEHAPGAFPGFGARVMIIVE